MSFTQWLRTNRIAAGILAIIRIYVGWGFLHAGWEKLTSAGGFSALGFLQHSMENPVLSPTKTAEYPWFNSFINGFAIPHISIFNFLVPWGEFLVGAGLILGVFTTTAAFFGMLMNFMYMFCGTISSNPMDVLLGTFIIVAGYNAGMFGGDFWVIPRVRTQFTRWFHHSVELAKLGGKNAAH